MIYLDVTDSCKSPMNTGIQRVVRGLFRALDEAGFPVTPLLWEPRLDTYCTLSRRERGFLEHPFSGVSGLRSWAEPGRAANLIPLWSKFARRTIHRRNRIDLAANLKAADVFLMPQIFRDTRVAYLARLGVRSGARRIGFFYDAIPWRRPDVTPPANVTGVVDYMLALANLDGIITASREATNDLRACWQAHLPRDRSLPPIHILLWPPDETFTANDATSVLPTAPRSQRCPKILCVGTLEPRKNHLTLLAAAEQLWHQNGVTFELEIIGRTTAHFGGRVLAEVDRLRAAGRPVAWRRHVDNATLLAAYHECAFTVYPTLVEGYGLPIIESLRRGRPCVCGANGALGELAADGGCLTVDQTDAQALAQGIRRLLTDELLYRRLCDEARAREFETWPGFVAKLLPLISP